MNLRSVVFFHEEIPNFIKVIHWFTSWSGETVTDTHTHTRTYMHTRSRTHTHARTYTRACTHMHTHIHAHIYTHTCACARAHTHTHTHSLVSDTSCSWIFEKKTELWFKDTTACSMDQGCGLILECKISVTWMTTITEPLQSLFICCQVHLGDDNNSELRKLVMQLWLLDRP